MWWSWGSSAVDRCPWLWTSRHRRGWAGNSKPDFWSKTCESPAYSPLHPGAAPLGGSVWGAGFIFPPLEILGQQLGTRPRRCVVFSLLGFKERFQSTRTDEDHKPFATLKPASVITNSWPGLSHLKPCSCQFEATPRIPSYYLRMLQYVTLKDDLPLKKKKNNVQLLCTDTLTNIKYHSQLYIAHLSFS